MVKALLVLPGNVLIVIPSLVLWWTNETGYRSELMSTGQIIFWTGLLAGVFGLGLLFWTVLDFNRFGQGTLAPWNPPKKFVIQGPYRHVRNPMISAILLVLAAEALVLKSLPIATWCFLFFIVNSIYIPFSEEKGLVKRFGMKYEEYKRHVPRWVPRVTPWMNM
ncbi:MAG: isoprenylcysteine carboxylmethyltransferase family protein [Nitrospina sp.]|nr:isoprenylcysteine carboxylmethyltransferase family protein [Nitrospina sp.]